MPPTRCTCGSAGGDERTIGYDIVVLAPGSRSRVLPVPGLAEHGIGFKTVQEAIYLRNHVLAQLDVAASEEDAARRRAALTFVFVGGGYAGVEALGELEDLARDAIENYPDLDASEMRWVLVDAADRILPSFPRASRPTRRSSSSSGGSRSSSAPGSTRPRAASIRLSDGETFSAETLVWTAGVKPSPLARGVGAAGGRARPPARRPLPPRRGSRGRLGAPVTRRRSRTRPRGTSPHPPRNTGSARASGSRPTSRPFSPDVRSSRSSTRTSAASARSAATRVSRSSKACGSRGFLGWFLHRSYHLLAMPTWTRRVKIAMDWTIALLFPRDLAQLGSLGRPRDPFERASGDQPS